MFLRNRVTGQVHDVPDHLVHGFHHVQEVDGFGEPLGLPFLAALAPMLTSILPAVLPAVGDLFKGGAPSPPPPAPVAMQPPPPPMESVREPIEPARRTMVHAPEDDMPPSSRDAMPMDRGAPPAGPRPIVIYRRKRRGRRGVRRAAPPSQVNGYGWWY